MLSAQACGSKGDEKEYTTLRNELLSIPNAEQLVPGFVRTNRTLDAFWRFIQQKYPTYAERRTFVSEQFTPLLDYLEFSENGTPSLPTPTPQWPFPTTHRPKYAGGGDASPSPRNKRKVFIVHGRDNEAKQEIARFISDLGLEPIILHEQVSSGMTIIEKIERYSNDADFALVLYTPCDSGRSLNDVSESSRYRARQNVVFEHGYLMAKLGRENVCALLKGDVETPNDISGVVYVPLDPNGGWKGNVSKELRACGYAIKSWF